MHAATQTTTWLANGLPRVLPIGLPSGLPHKNLSSLPHAHWHVLDQSESCMLVFSNCLFVQIMKVTSYYTQEFRININFVHQLSFWFMNRPHVIKRLLLSVGSWRVPFRLCWSKMRQLHEMQIKKNLACDAGFSNSKNCIWQEVRKKKHFLWIKKKDYNCNCLHGLIHRATSNGWIRQLIMLAVHNFSSSCTSVL